MSDNDDTPALVPEVIKKTALAAAGPVGAVVEALLTRNDHKWRAISERHFVAFVYETFEERAHRLEGAEDELERIRRVVQWLEEELAAMAERLGNVEAFAMGQVLFSTMTTIHGVWSENVDPEMVVHLKAAFRSLSMRRDRFRGSLSDALVKVLSNIRSDHVGMLKVIWTEEEQFGGLRQDTFFNGFGPYRNECLQHLEKIGLVRPGHHMFRNKIADSKWVTPLGEDFLRFLEINLK